MAIGEHADYNKINNDTGNGLYVVPNRSRTLLRRFYASSILTRICNREYEGELKKQGDSVTVPQCAIVPVNTHTKGYKFTYPTLEAPDARTLTVDQAANFEFSVDGIDKVQAYLKGFETSWVNDGNKNMKKVVDAQVINAAPASVNAYNKGLTAGKTSGGINLGTIAAPLHLTEKETYTDPDTGIVWWNAADKMADFSVVLSEQDIEDEEFEFFALMPPLIRGKIAQSKISDASMTGDAGKGVLRGGPAYVGEVQGFQTYKTNLLTKITTGGEGGNVGVFPIIFGIAQAWSFAAQIESMWSGQLIDRDAIGYRGVYVWGSAVMIPEGLGVAYVTVENKA